MLRPSTKAVDAALLLARALTPEPMRPGWPDALRHVPVGAAAPAAGRRSTSGWQHAAARPVIVPETIVCDHGMVYMSQTFRTACRCDGHHPASPPTRAPRGRRAPSRPALRSVATLFAQYVAGYVGSSVERRGKNAEEGAAWSMAELQDLLDEWIVAVWQNRPHDGLRDPLTPGRALTPNERYAALIEPGRLRPGPAGPEDYIELLPAAWRVINSYGVKIGIRTYDSGELNPYRRQHSGIEAEERPLGGPLRPVRRHPDLDP